MGTSRDNTTVNILKFFFLEGIIGRSYYQKAFITSRPFGFRKVFLFKKMTVDKTITSHKRE